jgi:anti-anti-sigma factor
MTLAQREGMCLIRLQGELNVASAAELKKLLLDALASQREVQVDLENASELDVTAVQLLWAAERETRASGKRFSVAGKVPELIAVSLREAGFGQFLLPRNQRMDSWRRG